MSEMRSREEIERLQKDLVAVCKKHGAVLFPRFDGKRYILSIMAGAVWLDYVRIDGVEALGLTPAPAEAEE